MNRRRLDTAATTSPLAALAVSAVATARKATARHLAPRLTHGPEARRSATESVASNKTRTQPCPAARQQPKELRA